MNHPLSPLTIGETRRRITYVVRVVEITSTRLGEVCVVESIEDGRRLVCRSSEVASWPLVP